MEPNTNIINNIWRINLDSINELNNENNFNKNVPTWPSRRDLGLGRNQVSPFEPHSLLPLGS